MINILVLEDEENSLKIITKMIEKVSSEIKIFGAKNLEEASQVIKKEDIKAFLLDINLDSANENNQDGIEFARRVRSFQKYSFTPIVMITSIANLELQAYRELHCYQYILKPYEESAVIKLMRDLLFQTGGSLESNIVVKKDGINYKINCNSIACIAAVTRGVDVTLVSQNKHGYEEMKIPYTSIKQLMEKLPEDKFFQCHRMYVVNKDFIEYVDIVNRVIHLSIEKDLEIGVTYKNEVKERVS